MRHKILLSLLLSCSVPVFAQQSTNYKLEEHVFNAGGSPDGGTFLSSPGFKIALSSLGDGLIASALTSPSYLVQGGFVGGHPAAGEVTNLVFADELTLEWDPEPSVGVYNLYRDLMSNFAGLGFGNCQQPGLLVETATDMDPVPPGDAYFFLVTAENTLFQEGIKGTQGNGNARLGPTCP